MDLYPYNIRNEGPASVNEYVIENWKLVPYFLHIRLGQAPDVAWNPWTDVRSRHDVAGLNLTFPQGRMPPLFARRIRQHYYAATSYVDDLIGRVLEAAALTSNGRETVVSLISDHGWSLGQHQEWAKYSAFLAANQVRDISVRRFFFINVLSF